MTRGGQWCLNDDGTWMIEGNPPGGEWLIAGKEDAEPIGSCCPDPGASLTAIDESFNTSGSGYLATLTSYGWAPLAGSYPYSATPISCADQVFTQGVHWGSGAYQQKQHIEKIAPGSGIEGDGTDWQGILAEQILQPVVGCFMEAYGGISYGTLEHEQWETDGGNLDLSLSRWQARSIFPTPAETVLDVGNVERNVDVWWLGGAANQVGIGSAVSASLLYPRPNTEASLNGADFLFIVSGVTSPGSVELRRHWYPYQGGLSDLTCAPAGYVEYIANVGGVSYVIGRVEHRTTSPPCTMALSHQVNWQVMPGYVADPVALPIDSYGASCLNINRIWRGWNNSLTNEPPEPVGMMPPIQVFRGGWVHIDTKPFFTDPEGGHLEYSEENFPDLGSAPNTFEDGVFVARATTGNAVIRTTTITATDNYGESAEQMFLVTMLNQFPLVDRPTIDPIPDQSITAGQVVNFDIKPFCSNPNGPDANLRYQAGQVAFTNQLDCIKFDFVNGVFAGEFKNTEGLAIGTRIEVWLRAIDIAGQRASTDSNTFVFDFVVA